MSVAARRLMAKQSSQGGPVGPGLASLDEQLKRSIGMAGETEAKD